MENKIELKVTSIMDAYAATRADCRLAVRMAERVTARRRNAAWSRAEAIAASDRALATCERIVAMIEAKKRTGV